MATPKRASHKAKPYRLYEETEMHMALSAVQNAGLSLRSASSTYHVPYATLRRHHTQETKSSQPGRKLQLGKQNELAFHAVVKGMLDMGYGLSKQELLSLAGSVSETLEDTTPFKNGIPSEKWFRRFKKDNHLSLRSPENMSMARYAMSSQSVKEEFFKSLKKIYDELCPRGLNACSIYNLDETGVCLVMKSGKILAPTGTKCVNQRTGGERGENITVLATVNAAGNHILPPTVIFRGKSLNEDLTEGAPDGTIFAHSPKSFIDKELFLSWFKRFVDSLPPARPVLVLLDGHGSHISLEVVEMARKEDITILCFPPHTTHLYQPLDVGVFKSLKNAVSLEITKLIRKNKRSKLNRYDFFKVFTPAWHKAVCPSNIIGGFKGSGIWPFNPDMVTLPGDEASACSTSDHAPEPAQKDDPGVAAQVLIPETNDVVGTGLENVSPLISSGVEPDCFQSPILRAVKNMLHGDLNESTTSASMSKSKNITKTRLLTSDEFMQEIKEKEKTRQLKINQKEEAKKLRASKQKKATGLKRKQKSKKTSQVKNGKADNRESKKKKQKTTTVAESSESDLDNPDTVEAMEEANSEDSEDNQLCGSCGKSFQKDFNGEQWICCTDCKTWYHQICQGIKEYRADFLCDDCVPMTARIK